MIKAYETPNGGKLLHDTATHTTFAVVDLAPAKENFIFATTVTWSSTDDFDVWSQFNIRDAKDVDIIAMLENIITANPSKERAVLAKYLMNEINAQDWLQ